VEPAKSEVVRQIDKQELDQQLKLKQIIAEKYKEFEIPSDELKPSEILNPIGMGTYGAVLVKKYYGYKVAFKLIMTLLPKDALDILEEAKIMSELRHPNIISLYGVVKDPKNFGIIMEYHPNGNLFDFLHKQHNEFTEEEENSVIRGLIGGIAYLHSKAIVHRDLKSSNVLLRNRETPILCDFGMAKILDNSSQMSTYKIGTILYNAPEIMRKEKYNYKSDVFSFGIILWEIVHKKIPYSEIKSNDFVQKIGFDGYRSPIDSSISLKIQNMITSCLQQDQKKRPSFSQILELINQ